MRGKLLPILAACALASAAAAQAPRTPPAPPPAYSIPAAAKPGTTTEITFFNVPAGEPVGVWTSFPAQVALVPGEPKSAAAPPRYRLTLPPDSPVGIHAVRVGTSGGLASPQLFMVDDLPSVQAAGNNRSPGQAQVLPEPLCAVDGSAAPLAADYYRIVAKKGQRIAFEVVAQRLGSRMDPLIRLLDGAGRELAHVDDTPGMGADSRFAHTFDADGDYVLELRDANYEGSPDHRYRLRVGDFPAVTVPFPLGARKGTRAAFEFFGPDGERVGSIAVNLPADVPRFSYGVKLSGGQSSALVPILCGERDELVAPAPNRAPRAAAGAVTLPASISGRLDAPGARHTYEFAGRKGDRVSLRGRTRSLNSPADLFLQVFKPDHSRLGESKIVEAKPVRNVPPPPPDEGTLDLTLPADGTYRVAVEDLTRGGGPAMVYRLDIDHARPDFALSVDVDRIETTPGATFRLKVKAERRGYDGPITLALTGAASEFGLKKNTIPSGKTDTELEAAVPASPPASGTLATFSIVGTRDGDTTPSRVASTWSAVRRIYPRLTFVPPEIDGPIGLLVRPSASAGGSAK